MVMAEYQFYKFDESWLDFLLFVHIPKMLYAFDNLYIYQDIKSVEVLGTSTLNINANITDLNIIIRIFGILSVCLFIGLYFYTALFEPNYLIFKNPLEKKEN